MKRWAVYDVRGNQGHEYVNDLKSLHEAVEVAKTYRDIYGDGSATHITRRLLIAAPPGSNFHHSGGLTHRWRVFPDGRMELLIAYDWPFKRHAIGIDAWIKSVPKPPQTHRSSRRSLATELHDLQRICCNVGFIEAEQFLDVARLGLLDRGLAVKDVGKAPQTEVRRPESGGWFHRLVQVFTTHSHG